MTERLGDATWGSNDGHANHDAKIFATQPSHTAAEASDPSVAPYGAALSGWSIAKKPPRATYVGRSPAWQQARVTQGQLDAVAIRCRQVLDDTMQRIGTDAVATIHDNVLDLCIEHSLAAAEHQVMRRASGRDLFQHYLEELAEQVYPDFSQQIENILPYAVTFSRVRVDCDRDCITFSFGLRPRLS